MANTAIPSFSVAQTATGGTVSDITVGTQQFRVHTFTSSGTFTVIGTIADVEYLIVGGGGGGGADAVRAGAFGGGGGGGAGGLLTGTMPAVSAGAFPIVVGDGGVGAALGVSATGSNGGLSSFDGNTAFGGGGGGGAIVFGNDIVALDGGSGGGAPGLTATNNAPVPPVLGSGSGSGVPGQGNDGGGATTGMVSGGGGGAGSVGGAAPSPTLIGGGGAGSASSITGISVTYAAGGDGVGGAGATPRGGVDGTSNTGDGGGGGNFVDGGDGGSGVVIIRYALTPEIDIESSSPNGVIADGGIDAQGNEEVGVSTTVTYTINNTGAGDLTLNGTPTVSNEINIEGTVSVGVPGALTVPAGGSTGFTVTYTPEATGLFSFELDIANDDADENPFDITVSGTGIDTVPPAALTLNAQVNPNGSIEVTGVAEPGTTVEVTFPDGSTQTVPTDPVTGAYTATSSPGQPSGDVSAVAIDSSGNASPTVTMSVITDQTSPGVEITGAPESTQAGGSFPVTITFTEDVTGFEAADIEVVNGSITEFNGAADVYTATITTTGQGNVTLSVPAGVAEDLAGNLNTVSNVVTVNDQTVSETVAAIGQFTEARSQLILQNQPTLGRRLDRLNGRTSNDTGISGFGLTLQSSKIPFSARISENEGSFSYSLRRARSADDTQTRIKGDPTSILAALSVSPNRIESQSFAHKSAQIGQIESRSVSEEIYQPQSVSFGLRGDRSNLFEKTEGAEKLAADLVLDDVVPVTGRYDLWIEGRYNRFDTGPDDGNFGIVHVGADYLVNRSLLIGLAVQSLNQNS